MSFHGQWSPPVDEVLLRNYFPAQRQGTFVECGAGDGVIDSCCLFFEELGWRGINLQTYLTLHGVWPHPLTVGEWVNAAPLRSTNHGDLMPYNFILGRDRVDAIDFDDYQLRPDADGLEFTISVLQARA